MTIRASFAACFLALALLAGAPAAVAAPVSTSADPLEAVLLPDWAPQNEFQALSCTVTIDCQYSYDVSCTSANNQCSTSADGQCVICDGETVACCESCTEACHSKCDSRWMICMDGCNGDTTCLDGCASRRDLCYASCDC